MYCSKCGVQNSEEDNLCVRCGNALVAATAQPRVKPKTNRLAIIVLITGVLFGALFPILGIPIIICGIFALVKDNRSQGQKGKGYAIVGIVIFVVLLLSLPLIMSQAIQFGPRVICGTNLKGLSVAMMAYVNDNDGHLPTENWCDLLMEKVTMQPKNFVCPYSDDIEWESSYAMNKNIAGMKMGDVSPNIVLFFETDRGLESGPRDTSIRTRKHYEWEYDNVVYKDRFNQLGGSEDLVFRHKGFFGQPGCNIVFADGHVEFVTEDCIGELKWTVD